MSNLDHFVVGVDGSTDAEFALQWAVAQEPRRITLVHGFSAGMELLAAGFQINLDPVRAEHDRLLGSAWAAPARDAGIDVDTVLVDDNAADALTYVAKSRGADAIVIGHRGHSRWSTQHVGHIAGHLLHHCEVPLIVTSDTTEAVPLAGTIVVALSRPTDPSNAELVWALDVAERAHTELHLVSLVEPLAYIDAKYSFDMANIHAEMRSQMSDLVSAIRPHHPSIRISTELRDGPAHQKLAAVPTTPMPRWSSSDLTTPVRIPGSSQALWPDCSHRCCIARWPPFRRLPTLRISAESSAFYPSFPHACSSSSRGRPACPQRRTAT
jgi:nucleotide-binding universal stress UspA family protein